MSKNIHRTFPDDSRLMHAPGHEYDWVVKASNTKLAGGQLAADLHLESGKILKLCVRPICEGIFNIRVSPEGCQPFMEKSPMLDEGFAPKPPKVSLKAGQGEWTFKAGNYQIKLVSDLFCILLLDAKGNEIWRLEDRDKVCGAPITPAIGYRDGKHPFFSWRIRNDEKLFGLGEKFNKVEKTGTRTTIWQVDTCGTNTTDMAYKGIPVIFSTAGWGLMLHSSFRNFWEVGTFSYTAGTTLTEDDKLDLYMFAAPGGLKDLLKLYTDLTGRPKMPPKWAFGLWMSRCQYKDIKEVRQVADTLRRKKIPCDVLHLDPLWMKTHYYYKLGVDACDFDWNFSGFPEPEKMFAEFKKDGFDVCLWINPYLPEGTPIYEEAKAKGYMLKLPDGSVARLEHGEPVGAIDFTSPQAKKWWQDHLKTQFRRGASVFKPDYGERVSSAAVFHNGKSGMEMHNLYLLLYNQAVYEATLDARGEGIVWGRSGYIGSHRYPGMWAGDTQITWRAMKCCLRGGLSAGLTGISFWSHDMGGFSGSGGPPENEMYTRWSQWGLLSPFSRFHGTTPREPWCFGPIVEKVVKHYTQLRYRLVPYIMSAGHETCRTGTPIMRHMALEFPDEAGADAVDEQYMLGPDILVAPVLVKGAKTKDVFLPAGTWRELEAPAKTHEGGGWRRFAAPLTQIPVLVRPGAVIPMLSAAPQNFKGGPFKTIAIDIYPGGGSRELVVPDENGELRVSVKRSAGRTRVRTSRSDVNLQLRFISGGRCVKLPKGVKAARSTLGPVVNLNAKDAPVIEVVERR